MIGTNNDGCYTFRIAADGSMTVAAERSLDSRFEALEYAWECGSYLCAESEPILYLEIVHGEVCGGFFAPFILGYMNDSEGERVIVSRAGDTHVAKASVVLIKHWAEKEGAA